MKPILLLFFLIILGCNKHETPKKEETTEEIIVHEISYKDFLKEVYSKTESEKSKYFFRYINYDIPKYWKDTA
ncbi:hypothetical protein [Chryseobacterium sp.]|uniref:hypothetical protein n=1 Tax=Chryseobacterium sp. TaxID=1871047 RepID=UPI00289C6278|nr:hypothetical protein [Chryseobacterium sp.]